MQGDALGCWRGVVRWIRWRAEIRFGMLRPDSSLSVIKRSCLLISHRGGFSVMRNELHRRFALSKHTHTQTCEYFQGLHSYQSFIWRALQNSSPLPSEEPNPKSALNLSPKHWSNVGGKMSELWRSFSFLAHEIHQQSWDVTCWADKRPSQI